MTPRRCGTATCSPRSPRSPRSPPGARATRTCGPGRRSPSDGDELGEPLGVPAPSSGAASATAARRCGRARAGAASEGRGAVRRGLAGRLRLLQAAEVAGHGLSFVRRHCGAQSEIAPIGVGGRVVARATSTRPGRRCTALIPFRLFSRWHGRLRPSRLREAKEQRGHGGRGDAHPAAAAQSPALWRPPRWSVVAAVIASRARREAQEKVRRRRRRKRPTRRRGGRAARRARAAAPSRRSARWWWRAGADGAKRTVYRITVRMDDGSFRTLSQALPPSVAVGEAVQDRGRRGREAAAGGRERVTDGADAPGQQHDHIRPRESSPRARFSSQSSPFRPAPLPAGLSFFGGSGSVLRELAAQAGAEGLLGFVGTVRRRSEERFQPANIRPMRLQPVQPAVERCALLEGGRRGAGRSARSGWGSG